jgi:hypothetical protein
MGSSLDQVWSSEQVTGGWFSKCEWDRAGWVSGLDGFGSGRKGFPLQVQDKEDSGSSNKEGDIVIVDGQNDPTNMVLQKPTISMDDVMMPLTDLTLHENVGSYQ